MQAIVPESLETTQSIHPTPVHCLHCGTFIQDKNSKNKFCCPGCEFVYQTINQLGLSAYYHIRPEEELSIPTALSSPDRHYKHLDNSDLVKKYVEVFSPQKAQVLFYLSGIHCTACIWLLEKLPHVVKGIYSASVQFASGQIEITFNPEIIKVSEIAYALNSFGYPPVPMDNYSIRAENKKQERIMLYRIGVAAVCAANAMMIAVSLFQGFYTGIEEPYASLLHWSGALIAAPAVFYSAIPFYRTAIGSLLAGSLHIDLPIAVAIVATYALGITTLLHGGNYVYFDSVTTLIFLLLVGRWIQNRAVSKARASAITPWDLLPTSIRVIEQGAIIEKDLSELAVGDVVEVRPWDRIPTDGVVIGGSSLIDKSFLTGESLPVEVKEGSEVLGGAINVDSVLAIKVSQVGKNTRLGKILSDIEKSQNERTPAEDSANKLSAYFVVGIFLLAIVTYVLWSFIDPSKAFDATVALLIVSCPCALGLAIPAAVTVSLGRAKKRGIFIRRSDAFEMLANAKHVYFDKTGTLTLGKIMVQEVHGLQAQTNSISFALASFAPLHPISKAIAHYCEDTPASGLIDLKHLPGKGVEGTSEKNIQVKLGSLKWLREYSRPLTEEQVKIIFAWQQKGYSISALAVGETISVLFALSDELSPSAKALVTYLQDQHKKVYILSGDSQGAVTHLAQQIGVPLNQAHGELFPEQKTEIITSDHSLNCMIGDGLNDAHAMKMSDVSIGLRGGIEATIEVASLYISSGKLSDVLELFKASKNTNALIHRNLLYSVFYNIAGAGAAMFGYVNPLVAAILMPVSSLSIILFSLSVQTFSGTLNNQVKKK